MSNSGQLEGRHAIREGYTHDSTGAPIQGDRLYWYEGVRWDGVTAMWPMGTKRPQTKAPVRKVLKS